jgi:DmsE family decaheme c-type cytochrome
MPDGAPAEPEYNPLGAKACMRCHDENEPWPVLSMLRTPHAQIADPRTPFAQHQCESCHGASPQHMEAPKPGQLRAPLTVDYGPRQPSPAAVQNRQCLTCHENKLRMHWQGSEHEVRGVGCVSCHQMHTQHDKVREKATQPAVCFTCHKQQRAEAYMPSHHPIVQGQVVCMNCHNPHGSSGPKMLIKNTVNETCYTCHADKRGPFLWEHPPAREDCRNCHVPHGAVQPRLLRARPPYLCEECHEEGGHPSTERSGTGIPPNPGVAQIVLKACLNCHVNVHGSNHPSGPRFNR